METISEYYTQIAKVISPPHLLFTGANGRKTFGVTVENTDPKPGYLKTWDINDSTLLNTPKIETMRKLGLSESEYETIISQINTLLIENNP